METSQINGLLSVFVQFEVLWFDASESEGCQDRSYSPVGVFKLVVQPEVQLLSPLLRLDVLLVGLCQLGLGFVCFHGVILRLIDAPALVHEIGRAHV